MPHSKKGLPVSTNSNDPDLRSISRHEAYVGWRPDVTAWIARQVPELKLDLPPTAIGKDWLGSNSIIGKAPSGTGYQFSIWGLFGILVGKEEGIEINIAGLNFGIDFKDIGVRLPGLGNIVARRSQNHTTIE